MADAKITELSAIASIAGEDLLAVVDDPSGTPATTKATVTQVKDYIISLANTWTATQTIDPADNTSALAVTGFSLTGSNAQSLLDLAGTWNTSGAPTGIKLNVTDTASNAASLLMDLQVSGSSRVSVLKSGAFSTVSTVTASAQISGANLFISSAAGALYWSDLLLTRRAAANLRLGAADAASPVAQTLSVQSVVAGTTNVAGANFTIAGSQGTGTGAGGSIIFQVAPAGSSGTAQNALATALTIGALSGGNFDITNLNAWLRLYRGATPKVFNFYDILTLASDHRLGWSSGTSADPNNPDTILARDAANTLALRNGTNAQAFRVYNTYTSATSFERGNIFWDSNVLKIGTEKGSTGGTARALELQTDGTTRLTIASTSGDVTTTGSMTTAAPAGGTAAAWKLGTVATVSPTSPNRTIEVDIGGTIYYIAAKTTND